MLQKSFSANFGILYAYIKVLVIFFSSLKFLFKKKYSSALGQRPKPPKPPASHKAITRAAPREPGSRSFSFFLILVGFDPVSFIPICFQIFSLLFPNPNLFLVPYPKQNPPFPNINTQAPPPLAHQINTSPPLSSPHVAAPPRRSSPDHRRHCRPAPPPPAILATHRPYRPFPDARGPPEDVTGAPPEPHHRNCYSKSRPTFFFVLFFFRIVSIL